jgi:hypothetical protein
MPHPILQVEDADILRRRVPPDQVDDDGVVMSVVFRDGKGELSSDLAKLRSRAETQARLPGCGLVEFSAEAARSEGLEPEHDPFPPEEPTNYAHVLCRGKLSSGRARRLRNLAQYCVKVGDTA